MHRHQYCNMSSKVVKHLALLCSAGLMVVHFTFQGHYTMEQQICTMQLLVLAAGGAVIRGKKEKSTPLGMIHENLMVNPSFPHSHPCYTSAPGLLVLQQVGPDPFLVDLPPVAWLQPQAFGNSLPSVVEWLPVPPHDLLLVSCYSPVVCASLGLQGVDLLKLRPYTHDCTPRRAAGPVWLHCTGERPVLQSCLHATPAEGT